jgi:hypothetical protein
MNSQVEGDAMETMTTMEPKKLELIQAQKTRVCELAREGAGVRVKIQKARDRERYDLWNEKRSIGDSARVALLAYAFLRGTPYRNVESRCRDLDQPQHPVLLEAARRSLAMSIEYEFHKSAPGLLESVIAWLSVPETEARKTKRAAAEAAGKARREERRTTNATKRSAA